MTTVSSVTTPERRQVVRRVEHVMGMPISLALDGRYAGTPQGEQAWSQVLSSLRDADAVFSTYRPDSAITRLGRGQMTLAQCPPEVAEVLALADVARLESAGAFDVRRSGAGGGTLLDPSGIVKGWAVDRAARALVGLEDTDFCLSAGGDLVCSTVRPESPAWRVGIEDPADPSRILAVVSVRDGAVATSGPARRGAHITDPRTGAVPRVFASVTVTAPTLTQADVDATAAFVLGDAAPEWLAGRPGRSAYLVRVDGTRQAIGFAAG